VVSPLTPAPITSTPTLATPVTVPAPTVPTSAFELTGRLTAGGVNRVSRDDPEGLGWLQQVKPFGIINAEAPR
jgi:hypothetical protein